MTRTNAKSRVARRRALPVILALISGLISPAGFAGSQTPQPVDTIDQLSLKDIEIPQPFNIHMFVRDFKCLKQLGKALFWDMQVGSDGIQACASCHWNGGADIRRRNQLNPGTLAGDTTFGNSSIPGKPGPNDPPFNFGFDADFSVKPEHFPFHLREPRTAKVDKFDPGREFETVLRDTNDIMSSMGVVLTKFIDISGGPVDDGETIIPDDIPAFTGKRRVEPRHAPTTINAAFNFDNFWEGRASAIFNGVNPHGFRDREATVKMKVRRTLQDVIVRIPHSSLASQAVGPPLSDFEMSWRGRNFADLGKKLLPMKPLAYQKVSTSDSLLGRLANRLGNGLHGSFTYKRMIMMAFKPSWWSHSDYQMEQNFALFFGLAVQEYEKTLIADDTPFDRFMEARQNGDPNADKILAGLTQKGDAKHGLDLFINAGRCNNCHRLPETTNHSIRNLKVTAEGVPQNIVELMMMGDGEPGFYDNGFYNISRRPTEEDIGRDANAPPTKDFKDGLPLSYVRLFFMKRAGELPPDVAKFVPDQALDENDEPVQEQDLPSNPRIVVRGAFKAASLRNLPLTGPYFHEGGDSTLRQIVEFYARGGNFPATNIDHLDPDIEFISELAENEQNINDLVAFLAHGLTDQRVKIESAPFDHPELFIPLTAAAPSIMGTDSADRQAFLLGSSTADGLETSGEKDFLRIPAVGKKGRSEPVGTFLNLTPFDQ